MQLGDGDLQTSVGSGLWPAERDQPALPGVRLTVRHTAYPDPPTEAFLSPDDAALLALSLLAAAAKATQS